MPRLPVLNVHVNFSCIPDGLLGEEYPPLLFSIIQSFAPTLHGERSPCLQPAEGEGTGGVRMNVISSLCRPSSAFPKKWEYGKGKGCATFSKTAFQASSVVKKEFQHMSICTSCLKLLLVYIALEAPILPCMLVLRKTQDLDEKSVVLGDFNNSVCNMYLKEFALQNNLKQLVSFPTHDKGNILDHLYVSSYLANNVSHTHHYLYFSDHDCHNIMTIMV